MEKIFSADELIEADYRLRCEMLQLDAVEYGKWIRRAFLYLIIFLLLSFPIFA